MNEVKDETTNPCNGRTQTAGGGTGMDAAGATLTGNETVEVTPGEGGTLAEGAPISSQELTELRVKAARADESWERYVRLNADFDNFKKRAARERTEASRNAQESLIGKLIPVLDNFEMAMAAASQSAGGSVESLRAGVQMINGQLKAVLTDAGLEEIDASGKPFDPAWHEAISQQESADVPEGHVLTQVRKGYRFKERLLRPASVVVARPPSGEAAA